MAARVERVHYVQQSLRNVQLRWFIRTTTDDTQALTVHLSITRHHGDDDVTEWMCERAGRANVDDVYSLPSHLLQAGHSYDVSVKLMSRDHDCCNSSNGLMMRVLNSRTLNFRLRYTKNEMEQLQCKAIEFIGKNGEFIPSNFFYRDKTEEYYDYCRHRCNGFLPLQLKNDNGDVASPVNGCIEGVYLGVNVDWKTGRLPATSPFGYCRFYVPIERVCGPDFNMYFADFYCHDGSKSHHLNLVLTRANSPADNFCRFRLPRLNIKNNPFLFQHPITGRMMHTTGAWIEIFYTEMIHVNSGWFDTVQWVFNTTQKTGRPKNTSCPICNI